MKVNKKKKYKKRKISRLLIKPKNNKDIKKNNEVSQKQKAVKKKKKSDKAECNIENTKCNKRNNPLVLFFILFVLMSVVAAGFLSVNYFPDKYEETTSSDFVTEQTAATTTEESVTEAFCLNNYDTIQQQIDYIAERNGAVGVQVAVIEDGSISGLFNYGWAKLNKTEMTDDHKIRVASISKILVGIAAMLLYEDGIIDIDKSIAGIWDTEIQNPYYPDDPITIRNMLNHTSSIYSYGDDYSMYYSSVKNRFKNCYSELRPGDISAWCYNNYVFRALGMTLELAADRKLDDILAEKVYGPLDIDAAFAAGDIKGTDLIVTLYDEDNNVERSADRLSTFHCSENPGAEGLYYAGGLTISANDLAKIVCMLVNEGEYEGQQILSKKSVRIMESCFTEPLEDGTYQGTPLVYMPGLYGREGIYFHTGSAYGSFNCMSYDPKTGDGVVVLTTGAVDLARTADIRYICDDINSFIYDVIR